MADPTSVVTAHQSFVADADRSVHVIKNSEALVPYAFVDLNTVLGKIQFSDQTDGSFPIGLVLGAESGDNINDLTGDSSGINKGAVRGGIILESKAVTGAGSITDAGKPVWATDGQTLTLTRQAGPPIGFVVRWRSSTLCDVYILSFVESWLLNMGWAGQSAYKMKYLGTHLTNAMQGTSAATLWKETAYEHYEIVSWHAIPVGFDDAAVAGDQDLNLEIGGTTVKTTGGTNPSVLNLLYTSCDATGDQGTVIDASAVVSANEVHIGDVLEVVQEASGTGFTADAVAAFAIWALVKVLPGV